MTERSVPDAVAPPPRHPRFPLFDGLRAIAVFSVLLVHVQGAAGFTAGSVEGRLLTHLDIGVTIFFLISGFLLYRPFIAHRIGGAAAPETPTYAKRRFLRIYPAYWLCLTVLVLLPMLPGIANGEWWEQYSLLFALPVHSGPGCFAFVQCGLPQTWSLVVELTFYAALPLYAVVANRLARGREPGSWLRIELVVLAVLFLVPLIHDAAFGIPGPRSWWGGSVIGYMEWFTLGMGLALASVAFEVRGREPAAIRFVISRPVVPWLGAVALYIALCLYLPGSAFAANTGQFLVTRITFGLVALLLLLPAVFGDASGGVPRRFLANPVVAWLGLISYGVFLWHAPIVYYLGGLHHQPFAVVLAGAVVLSIAIAALSYYLVERPILRLKYRPIGSVLRRGRDPAAATPR